jgi:hypothetical protein
VEILQLWVWILGGLTGLEYGGFEVELLEGSGVGVWMLRLGGWEWKEKEEDATNMMGI